MNKRINIVGCGRAAGSLARLWLQADAVLIGDVLNRSMQSSQAAIKLVGAGTVAESLTSMGRADYWLIGTSDHQIKHAARALATARRDLGGTVVFHLAGRFGLEALAPLKEQGAEVAAVHPVRSLTHDSLSLKDFEGTACVAEGSERAMTLIEPLVTTIGGSWLPVKGIDRGLYHASVAIISNITKAIAWKAQKWQEKAGLPSSTAATVTHQLLHSTMEDLFRSGARQSITGPVVRGDTSTIEAHLQALASTHPDDVEVYRVLARTVLELAKERGDLDQETLSRFEFLLGP